MPGYFLGMSHTCACIAGEPVRGLPRAERTVIICSTPSLGQEAGEIRLPHSGTPREGCGHRGFQFLLLLLRNADLFQGRELCNTNEEEII